MRGQVPSAAQIAALLVAASARCKVDPARVFERRPGNGQARIMAALAACALWGLSRKDAGRLFRLAPTELAPGRRCSRRVFREDIEAVAAVLGGARFPEDPDPAAGGTGGRTAPKPAGARPEPAKAPVRRAGPGWVRRRKAAPAAPARARTVRLRPLTARRADLCARFLEAGWSAEDTAWLFDTDPEAMLDALEHGAFDEPGASLGERARA